MDLEALFSERLTEDQKREITAFQKAAERIGKLIRFGVLSVTYHQSAPIEYIVERKARQDCNN